MTGVKLKRKEQVIVHSASLFGDLCAIRTVSKFGLRWSN